jgi:transposase
MDKESLEQLLAKGLSVAKIAERFGKHPSTISYWIAKHGLEAANRQKHAAKGGIDRERLTPLVDAGMSVAEISAELDVSTLTVRRWLTRHGLRTKHARTRRVEEGRDAKSAGLATVTMLCDRHGDGEFVLEGRGYYRCKRCRSEGIARHRRRLKATLVAEAGGRCTLCGYARCVRALEFHHVDPAEKRIGIAMNGLTLSLDALRAEARKCVLVCSNCHAELEAGVTVLPDTVSTRATDGP